MRRYLSMLFILIVLLACRLNLPVTTPTPALPPATSTPTVTPLPASPTVTSTSIPTPASTPTSTYSPPAIGFTLETHPDGPLYVGDQVSLSILAPPGTPLDGAKLSIEIDQPGGLTIGPGDFGQWGIAGRHQATFVWGWDTRQLEAGQYTLSFSIQPQGYAFTDTVTLLPASAIPPAQVGAEWDTASTECCAVHYITGTAVERDLIALTAMIDQQAQHAVSVMGIDFTDPITITVMPRVLGHGGFASNEIYVTYLDRNYAANSWEMVVHHEMIHILDGRLGGDLRPSMLVEGLAVFMSGGHYKPEALLPRAAALLEGHLDLYIPLSILADDFYAAQHEIGYLEAAAFIEYLVNTYGWEEYETFYRDIQPIPDAGQSAAIDAALQVHFSLSLAEVEADFITYLGQQPASEQWQEDVRVTVLYFDTMRRYQQLLDPSAYFRTAWLMDGPSMRQRGIVGDFLRHPSQPENQALEALFISASDAWVNGNYEVADEILTGIDRLLDAIEQGLPDPFATYPVADDYLVIARITQQNGYEVQSIELSGDTAAALVTAQNFDLFEVVLTRQEDTWTIN